MTEGDNHGPHSLCMVLRGAAPQSSPRRKRVLLLPHSQAISGGEDLWWNICSTCLCLSCGKEILCIPQDKQFQVLMGKDLLRLSEREE